LEQRAVRISIEADRIPRPLVDQNVKLEFSQSSCFRETPERLKVEINKKHTRVDKFKFSKEKMEETLFIHISKDIFSWMRSMYNRPHFWLGLKEVTFEGFLLTPWDSSILPTHPPSKEFDAWPWAEDYYENIFQLRAIKLQSFLTVQPCLPYNLLLRYEDLNVDPIKYLQLLSSQFNISLNSNLNVTFCFMKHGDCVTNLQEENQKKKNYYLQRKYLTEYNNNTLKMLHHNMNFSLENVFGYDYSTYGLPGFDQNLRFPGGIR